MAGGTQDIWGNKLLGLYGGVAITTPVTVWIGLFNVLPAKDGTGGTEVSGGSYARVAVTCNLTNFPAAVAQLLKLATLTTFPLATADWSTLLVPTVGYGIFDAASAGNCLHSGHFVTAYFAFTGVASDTCTAPGTAYANGTIVVLQAVPGSTLPVGLSAGTIYYVINASTDTFKLSLTSGGAAVDITADGSGLIGVIQAQALLNGSTPNFPANTLQIQMS